MKENFQRKILDNGMTILFEKRELPVVSVIFAVRAGGINEDLNEKGISHFIEHMLYKGTDKRNSKQIAEEIEKKGGDLNGFTSEEITGYWCKMPSEYLNTALDVLSDMIKNPVFNEQEVEKERKVIFEEIKMYKDNPRMYVFEEIQKCLYTGTMGLNLAGTFETMNAINKEKLVEAFKKIYAPDNLILCVVGDANFDQIVDYAKANFGNQKNEIKKQTFKLKNEIKQEKRRGIDQANLVFAYHTPLANNTKSYAARVLSVITSEGMSSRLFSEIREKRNLAYAVKGGSEIGRDYSYNWIYIGTTKENIEKVKEIILEEFKKISDSLDKNELEEVKKQIVGNFKISLEDSQKQMLNLLISEIHESAENFYDFEKNILSVKLSDVKDISKNAFENYSFFVLVPE